MTAAPKLPLAHNAKPGPQIESLTLLRAFVAVVDAQSFSEAGRWLGVVPSTMSKYVTALETKLQGKLIIRSTTQLSITELGQRFYERCLFILREVEEAEVEIGQYNAEPQGILRMTAATVFATKHLAPSLQRFAVKYPKVALDLMLSSTNDDLIANGIDVAIRISNALDPGLIALKLAPNIRVFCATPSYLAEYGTPISPEDLLRHNCLVVRGVSHSALWSVATSGGELRQIPVSGNFVCNNVEIVCQALLAGNGVAHLPRFVVQEHLDSGRLVEFFPESRTLAGHIFAVYPDRRNMPLKTRVMLDHLKAEFRPLPAWAV